MPEPGSHAYDVQRQRLRNELDNQGIPDANATAAANEQLQGGERSASPALATERARGPAGARGGGGDPGNVVTLRSQSFSDGTVLASRYARDGENVSPALEWSDLPPGTVELALVVEDRDAGSPPVVHWAVTGIDPESGGFGEGQQPAGTVWPNYEGERAYAGPRPPVGDEPHRYVFRLYALTAPVSVSPDADVEKLRDALESTAAATGTITARFGR